MDTTVPSTLPSTASRRAAAWRSAADETPAFADTLAALYREEADPLRRRMAVLEAGKQALAASREEVRARFHDGDFNGIEAAHELAQRMDAIVAAVHDCAAREYPSPNPTAADRLAVVGVGGYGRGELAPQSDIDLLFLLPWKLTPRGEQVVEFILYLLWDLGLKVGHSTRSVDECVRLARQDITIRTALLESRLLLGDTALFADLRRAFRDKVATGTALEFVTAKLAERDTRHKRLGDSRYVVEPNIKEGKGGLRDLQTLYWIGKYVYDVNRVGELVGRGVLTAEDTRTFRKAERFLWAVRFHLHDLTGRAEERLTFDVQPELARRMGYTDHAGALGVERFMKHFYLVAKDVGSLTRIYCAAIEAEHMRRPLIRLPRLSRGRDVGGFREDSGRLTVAAEDTFERDPVAMIRLFHVAFTTGLDIHPHALRLITRNLARIDRAVRDDPEANRLFMDILCAEEQNPEIALRRMNEAGVFGKFVPDFGRVVGQTQHDMYHVFTVDEHTIFALGLLHRIELGELSDDHPLATRIIHKLASRRALYVALLFHDIAKGRGGDHSEVGARLVRRMGPRLGLSEEETETVEWLVLHHLDMSNVAQKRDLADPKTIADFARITQSPERLRLLLCLTVADMRATSPKVWNNWKAELLHDLYNATEEALSGSQQTDARDERVRRALAALRTQLADWSEADFETHVQRGYPGYWLAFPVDTLARQARQVRAAEADGQKLSIDTRVDAELAVTEITVYTQDHPGLFSRLAGAFAAAGANVVDARIFTTPQGMALDAFWLQDAEGEAYNRPDKLAKLAVHIERALGGDFRANDARAEKSFVPTRTRVFNVPPRVLVDNAASATHTVVEINGRDRPGFLYDVTRALYGLALQISSAKISTYGERAVDVFYVKDMFGMKVEQAGRIEKLRAALLEAIERGDAEDRARGKGGRRQAAA
ncbi:MAG: [protein-PII] uridylyltransferase [Alphaproteobacteria bacterium]|nr:[protein-PII] uridylyltransferase [Alphaproteobacteria bacterium]